MYKSVSGLSAGIFLSIVSISTVYAADSIEQRLQRLENLLGNQVLMEQSQQMQQIRQELTDIRALVENQEHQLGLIKQRQRNLYQDMDRRLHDLEAGTGKRSTSSSPSVAPIAPPAATSNVAAPTAESSPAAAVKMPGDGDKDGKFAYKQAFNVLKEGRYQQAIIAFRDFMQNYPESIYLANAQYWLAEANYVSRDYKTALAEFQKILTQFSTSSKVQDAELKIGYTFYEMKDWASTRTALERVIKNHPNTTVARKAEQRLERMKREGH